MHNHRRRAVAQQHPSAPSSATTTSILRGRDERDILGPMIIHRSDVTSITIIIIYYNYLATSIILIVNTI